MWSPEKIPALTLAVLTATTALTQAEPRYSQLEKHQTPVPYFGVRGWYITQNLGPTGMRGWIDWNHPHSPDTSPSREILIRSVEEGSPADGILRPYDIILGVANEPGEKPVPFTTDARLAFARAITQAESETGQGKLALLCWRDGGSGVVTLNLPVLGDYSDVPPPDCPKTRNIVGNAAAHVARHVPAMGDNGLTGAQDGLFLLGTGDPRYLDAVRRTAHRLADEPVNPGGHNTWPWSHINLFLSEYFLATGDKTVLPQIEAYSNALADGQCNPGTWGHRGVEGSIPPGYGSVNSTGVIAFLSLVTANQCGVTFDHSALVDAAAFYGGYAGRGGLPYGDHPPTDNSTGNGKNGGAAVAFHLLGSEPATQWFARLSASANLLAFEGGHTGNFFNQVWTPLGASLSGEANFRNFRAAFHNYRDLARRWDGSFITQPWPHTREGCLGFSSYINRGPGWSTAGFGLSMLGGTNELAMLGRTRSVFSPDAPGTLALALAAFHELRFADSIETARPLATSSDADVAEFAAQLVRTAERNLESIAHTLADMRTHLAEGDLFLVKHQLRSLEAIVDPADARLTEFRTAVTDPANADTLKDGENYHSVITGHHMLGHRGFQYFSEGPQPQTNRRTHSTLARLAGGREGFYQHEAARWLAERPQEPATTKLVDGLTVGQEITRETFHIANPAQVGSLELTLSLVTHGSARIVLNGTTIMHLKGPINERDVTLPLKPATVELLKRGSNELGVHIDARDRPFEASVTIEGKAKS